MKNIIVDTGPLVALFDKNDNHHQRVLGFFESFRGQLHTTWPVITETSHLLDFSTRSQIDFYTWMIRGALNLHNLEIGDMEKISRLTLKYIKQPMDLADASLVILAEKLKIKEIASLDRDFFVYRLPGKKSFLNLLDL